MQNFSAQNRTLQVEVILRQEQQNLEDQMVKDQKEVIGVQLEDIGLRCLCSKTSELGIKSFNFKKKLRKADIKIRKWKEYLFDFSGAGFMRQIKDDIKIFSADAENMGMNIESDYPAILKASSLKKLHYLITKQIDWERISFDRVLDADLAQLLIFSQNSRNFYSCCWNFVYREKSLEFLRDFHPPTSRSIMRTIYISDSLDSALKLDQLFNYFTPLIEALLSSKFIESLESIEFNIYYRSNDSDYYSDEEKRFFAVDSTKFFGDIPEIEIYENKAIVHDFKYVKILFPEGQKQDAASL